LQFVVMTLIAERPRVRAPETGSAFSTPTVMHFSSVLLLSAILRAPWGGILPAAALWGLLGATGATYSAIVARRMHLLRTVYQPVVEDWSFHVLVPFAGYVLLAICALAAPLHARGALFGVGAGALLLLFSGIHNSWDAVSFLTYVQRRDGKDEG
jgi:hypothetical protein